ncbi:hypothetical protein B398_10735 [Xylella fastidiosa 32]|nr:hypothetical protein B398_10735 [Xylella fastidiosa 32]
MCIAHFSSINTIVSTRPQIEKYRVPLTEQQQTPMKKWLWLQQSDVVFILWGVS